MADTAAAHRSLGDKAAFQLANVTKTPPQYGAITPRWLVRLLDWKPLEAGTLRVNRVVDDDSVEVVCESEEENDASGIVRQLRGEAARVHAELDLVRPARLDEDLRPVQQSVRPDPGAAPADDRIGQGAAGERADQQRRVRAAQERARRAAHQDAHGPADPGRPRRAARQGLERAVVLPGAPARDRGLRARVHASRRSAGDGHDVRRAVPHLARRAARSDRQAARGGGRRPAILLLRVGEKKQGVIGMYQPGLPGEQTPGLSVRFMGIDQSSVASYLVALYCSAAVLTDDAIAALDGVDVGSYHEYK